MEAGVDDQAAYLAADLRFHDRILAVVPQRAPRAPRRRPARRAPRRRSRSRRRRAARGAGRCHFTGRSSTGSPPATRTRAETAARTLIADTAADIRRIAARDGSGSPLTLTAPARYERRAARTRAGTTTLRRPSASVGRRRPAGRCSPRTRPSDAARATIAPIASASSTASAASMFPTIPRASRSASRPLIGSSATSTPSGSSAASSASVTIVSPAW